MRQHRGTVALTALLASLLLLPAGAPAAAAAGPPNDDIRSATRVPGLPYDDAVDLSGAAANDPDDPRRCFPAHHTVWYAFTPAFSGDVAADTFGSDFDTTLAVFTGTPSALSLVVCNDDFQSAQSRLSFSARAGVRYWIMLGSYYEGFAGVAFLHLRRLPPRLELGVTLRGTGTVSAAGVATVTGTVTCSRPADVTVVGSVRQSRSIGYFTVDVACRGRAVWTGRTPGDTGRFRPGTAHGTASASSFDPRRSEVVRAYAERLVTLERVSRAA